jgi:DNA-binding CsgD family transcriptional regulator
MRPTDVNGCLALAKLVPEEVRRHGPMFEKLPWALLRVLRDGSLNSSVIEDIEGAKPRVVAWGASVFVTDSFLRSLKASPIRWIAPELTRHILEGRAPILSPREIQQANSEQGLNAVVWGGMGIAPSPHDQMFLNLEIVRAFEREHLGYQFKELILQPVGLEPVEMSINWGARVWHAERSEYLKEAPSTAEKLLKGPFLLGFSRDFALQDAGSWGSSFFVYSRPKVLFRPAEQRLLLAALRGLTDSELSDELAISLSAVKKTWLAIYDRAGLALGGQFGGNRNSQIDFKRGKEKKQRLLAYLRVHMEELRPVLPSRAQRVSARHSVRESPH